MNTVVAGRFADQANARQAVAALAAAGFDRSRIASMRVDPPTRKEPHDAGDDPATAAETESAESGAVNGTLAGIGVGTVVGLATLPFLGPVAPFAGAAVGAYVGSFAGVLEGIDDSPATVPSSEADAADANGAPRKSETLVGVGTSSPAEQESAIGVLRAHGASLATVEGSINDGRWTDQPPNG